MTGQWSCFEVNLAADEKNGEGARYVVRLIERWWSEVVKDLSLINNKGPDDVLVSLVFAWSGVACICHILHILINA